MDLYVLRHGLAAARGSVEYPYDADRPLTPKGTRRMVRQARGLNALGLSLDVILTSPLVRALETAKIVHRELDSPGRLVESEALAPMAHPAKLIDQLAMDYPSASNVMIVGHEPYLSGLISLIVSGDTEPMIRLKKGALCKLRMFAARHGRCGWIEWSMTPRHMVKLA